MVADGVAVWLAVILSCQKHFEGGALLNHFFPITTAPNQKSTFHTRKTKRTNAIFADLLRASDFTQKNIIVSFFTQIEITAQAATIIQH